MRHFLSKIIAPLSSLFIFMLSNGLFTTLTALRLHNEHYSSFAIGLVGAAFYSGLFIGSFQIEKTILRIGHIRSYAVFAAGLTAMYLLQGLIVNIYAWTLFRIIAGMCTAGIFIVIESWILVSGSVANRGKVLAVYMVVLYFAQASGQFMLNLASPELLDLFAISGLLGSISIIPLAMTRSVSPKLEEPSFLSLKKLYQLTSSGLIGCLTSGATLSVIYSLIPLYTVMTFADDSNVATIMAIIIFGGMAMQYPIGRLSDIIERRKVLIALNLLTVLISLLFIIFQKEHIFLYVLFFIFGGVAFTLYPVSISHACDSLDEKDVTAGTQALLLTYSAGAVIGPVLAPFFIRSLGANGLFSYLIIINLLMVVFVSWRRIQKAATPQEAAFIPVVQTTPVINEIDPRTG